MTTFFTLFLLGIFFLNFLCWRGGFIALNLSFQGPLEVFGLGFLERRQSELPPSDFLITLKLCIGEIDHFAFVVLACVERVQSSSFLSLDFMDFDGQRSCF